MITRSKQVWEIGSRVNVGFLKNLIVIGFQLTPGDYLPDRYTLTDETGAKRYEFTPHNGISRID